jgi:hypothetical protein
MSSHQEKYFNDMSQFVVKLRSIIISVQSGLPDGLFSNQKYHFGYILEGLGMENVDIFMTTCNISQSFGKFYGNFV